jgi:hypothetical protein
LSDQPLSISLLFSRESLKIPELVAIASAKMKMCAQLKADAVSPAFWAASAYRVVDMVDKLTDVPLADVLVGGWKIHKQFAKYSDPARFPPDKVSCVALSTHHIKSSYEPYVELIMNGAPAGKVEFALELDVCLEAGTLVIQGGRIKRLEAGKCRVTGTLKCEKQAITERTSRDFSWSDGISFGEGVSIAALT